MLRTPPFLQEKSEPHFSGEFRKLKHLPPLYKMVGSNYVFCAFIDSCEDNYVFVSLFWWVVFSEKREFILNGVKFRLC